MRARERPLCERARGSSFSQSEKSAAEIDSLFSAPPTVLGLAEARDVHETDPVPSLSYTHARVEQ
jgi:hypothetical protein